MLWPPSFGCVNLPSQPAPSHFHCSPLVPIRLRPSAAKSWLCWSLWQKSQTPRKLCFHWSCHQNRQPEGWSAQWWTEWLVLKCLFVHSPLALYDLMVKALTYFSIYYCVKGFSIITVSWILWILKRPFQWLKWVGQNSIICWWGTRGKKYPEQSLWIFLLFSLLIQVSWNTYGRPEISLTLPCETKLDGASNLRWAWRK